MYVWKLAVAFFLISLFFNFSCQLLLTNLCYAEAIKATAFIIKDTIFVSSKEYIRKRTPKRYYKVFEKVGMFY